MAGTKDVQQNILTVHLSGKLHVFWFVWGVEGTCVIIVLIHVYKYDYLYYLTMCYNSINTCVLVV